MTLLRRCSHWFFVLLLVIAPSLANAQQAGAPRRIISLDGSAWKLVGLQPGEGEKLGIQLSGLVKAGFIPTSVPNDVQRAIGLKDPFGQGPEVVDVNKREWWYVRSFSSPRVAPAERARLVFDGVDYFSDVWLNGEKLGSHEGAFTHFAFDVTQRLRANGENYLAVRVTCPWKVPGRSHYEYMKGEFDSFNDDLPGPGQIVFPMGLHRSVRLEVAAATRLEDLLISTSALTGEGAELKLEVVISSAGAAGAGTLRVAISPEDFSGPRLELPSRSIAFSGRPGESQTIQLTAQVKQPQLWWTWDQGPQNLYTAQATLENDRNRVIDRLSSRFGIRTLERDDQTMLYKLNGRPILVQGAWLSMSKLYPGDVDRWTYEKDFRLARNANMNHLLNYTMVEKDDFYELADRMGFLVFVELPFNQMGPQEVLHRDYPGLQHYLNWSAEEVKSIVRSLANHPSVGVWAPVSEVMSTTPDWEAAWGPAADAKPEDFPPRLFSNKLQEVVRENDSHALYLPSFCDFGEHHFWYGGAHRSGTTYDQNFDAQAGFISEYGGQAFFPLEDMRRLSNAEELWGQSPAEYSSLALPVDITKLSYLSGFNYFGQDFVTGQIATDVDRHVRSFRELVNDSQVHQAFIYGYAGDAFRRKIFAPVNGIRSWDFKSFQEKPILGYGVIDAYDTPLMAYYEQRRSMAPVSLSLAVRYALESVPAGSAWNVPVWISNATNDTVSLSIDSSLYNLKGERLRESQAEVSVPARAARQVAKLDWQLPDVPGIYLVRSHGRQGSTQITQAETYVKVAPAATRKKLRVLVLGTAQWAPPVADYLTNLGASVTTVVYTPVGTEWERAFPDSAESLCRMYDVLWLTGFNNYWREAPERMSQIIVQAVATGLTFIHTGGWGSFHGGDAATAALDLTPLAQILPVEVEHQNDIVPTTGYRTGAEINAPPPSWPGPISASELAPQWLREVDFTGLTVSAEPNRVFVSGPGYHKLNPRPDAKVLLRVGDHPLLVSGHYGKGLTFAYLGFSPERAGAARVNETGVGANDAALKSQPVIVDRAIRATADRRVFTYIDPGDLWSASNHDDPSPLSDLFQSRLINREGHLFTIVSASLLALASGEEAPAPISRLLQSRVEPLFETLKNMPRPGWPEVSLAWNRSSQSRMGARIHIHNGAAYFRGLRLRFEGPDFLEGNALAVWSNQFFDLLPGEDVDCSVEIFTDAPGPLRKVSLLAETLYGQESKSYAIPALPE